MPYRVDFAHVDEAGLLRLLELGALDADLSADGHGAALLPDAVAPARVAQALGVETVAISPAIGRDADSVWLLAPRSVRLGRLRLTPADHVRRRLESPGTVWLLDTPAFGTGLHPTTSLCAEIIDERVAAAPVTSMLDVGTGSGVLALVALALGVPRVVAIDVEGGAVRAAVANARLNGYADRMLVVHGDLDAIAGQWPLVVANVLAAPLMAMAATLARRVGHGGEAVLSGIPCALEDDVTRVYRRLGMHVADVRERSGWIAILLRASW